VCPIPKRADQPGAEAEKAIAPPGGSSGEVQGTLPAHHPIRTAHEIGYRNEASACHVISLLTQPKHTVPVDTPCEAMHDQSAFTPKSHEIAEPKLFGTGLSNVKPISLNKKGIHARTVHGHHAIPTCL
jgi:hypothetical protein